MTPCALHDPCCGPWRDAFSRLHVTALANGIVHANGIVQKGIKALVYLRL
jgi:hypothetical protein